MSALTGSRRGGTFGFTKPVTAWASLMLGASSSSAVAADCLTQFEDNSIRKKLPPLSLTGRCGPITPN
jgi:hypothetical protein